MKITFFLLFLSTFCSMGFTEDIKVPAVEAKLIFGASAFLDEAIPFDHSIFGGSIPIYLTQRLSIEPQLLYMKGPGTDHDFSLTGNVAYDLVRKERLTFYVVGGGGIFHHFERFGSSEFTDQEWTVHGGIGAKLFLSKRIFIAPDFRFGWEPLLTATMAIGFVF